MKLYSCTFLLLLMLIYNEWSRSLGLYVSFYCRCADGDNATLPEFEEVLKAMKMDSLIPLAPRVFDLFDNNRDGTVDMRELLCGLSSLKNSQGDEALQICFQVLIHQHQLNPPTVKKFSSIIESCFACSSDVWHRSVRIHIQGRISINAESKFWSSLSS